MADLVWTRNLNTGIEVIDDQHRRIVAIINLLRAAKRRGSIMLIGTVIDDLIDYTTSHFAFEEALMEDADYPMARAHKHAHDLHVKNMTVLQQRFRAGEDIADELNGLVSSWLLDHILDDDAAYTGPVMARMREIVRDRREGGWLARSLKQYFRHGSIEHRV